MLADAAVVGTVVAGRPIAAVLAPASSTAPAAAPTSSTISTLSTLSAWPTLAVAVLTRSCVRQYRRMLILHGRCVPRKRSG